MYYHIVIFRRNMKYKQRINALYSVGGVVGAARLNALLGYTQCKQFLVDQLTPSVDQ